VPKRNELVDGEVLVAIFLVRYDFVGSVRRAFEVSLQVPVSPGGESIRAKVGVVRLSEGL
jgi:hypothetical protein